MTIVNHNTRKQNNKLFSENGQIIGWIEGNAICKRVKASMHMLQIPRGWAWDKSILIRADELHLTKTVIHDKEADIFYVANLEDFWLHGVSINRGFGEQICLPLMYWKTYMVGDVVERQLEFPFS